MTFTCDLCGKESEMSPPGIAERELHDVFGAVNVEDCAIVCDECWEKIKPSRNPEQFQEWCAND